MAIKKILINKDLNSYKANMHCHSTYSDGNLTVEQLKKAYMEHGYSIIAFTDHDDFFNHNELSDDKFLAINSYEINVSDEAVKDGNIRKCYHFCCYSKDSNLLTYSEGELPDYYDTDGVNALIKKLNGDNFLVCYNHPIWSLQNYDDYKGLKGLFASEIFNFSAYIDGLDGNQEAHYDNLLRLGNDLCCFATDDNHDGVPFDNPFNDSFGGYIVVKANVLDYNAVITAIRNKEFYASMGPEIYSLYVEDDTVHIECSPVTRISMTNCGRNTERCYAENGKTVTKADFKIRKNAKYFRITITDANGKRAYTNAYKA